MRQKIDIHMEMPEGEKIEEQEQIVAWLLSTILGCKENGIECEVRIDGVILKVQPFQMVASKTWMPS